MNLFDLARYRDKPRRFIPSSTEVEEGVTPFSGKSHQIRSTQSGNDVRRFLKESITNSK